VPDGVVPAGTAACGPLSATPAAEASPDTPNAANGVATSTVFPSGTSRSVTTPSKGLGSSTRDLAVSISTMTWLTVTESPGFTFQETMSASVSPSPTSGSLNCFTSAMKFPVSERERAVDGVEHPVQVGQVVILQPGWRVGGGKPADPQD